MKLRIVSESFSAPAQRTPLVGGEADAFQSAAEAALKSIRSTDIGADLLHAIDSAAHEVLILKAGPKESNKCHQVVDTPPACNAASYEEVLDADKLYKKIQELLKQEVIGRNHPAVRKFQKFYVQSTYKATYFKGPTPVEVPLAHKGKHGLHGTDQMLKDRVETFDSNARINEGRGLVRYLQNGLIGYHVMNHLKPGAGTSAWVIWDPALESVRTGIAVDKQAAWMDRPPWIALAHELIHAWRLACGRCVFRPNGSTEYYYEEAMTVGLPPYDGCRYTENRFRALKGLPLRTFYGEETRNQTTRAALKHGALKFSIAVVGSGPADSLVFDYEIRPVSKSAGTTRGKTDTDGHATAEVTQGMLDSEIRFLGFGAFGRVETQWQKIVPSRYMTLQFGRYRFICEPL